MFPVDELPSKLHHRMNPKNEKHSNVKLASRSGGEGRWLAAGGYCESGRVDVFARDVDDHLIHTWFKRGDGGWRGWEHLGGVLASAPAAVSGEPGRVDVFARGNNNKLVHKWYVRDDGGWRDWEHLGGALTSAPAAVSGV